MASAKLAPDASLADVVGTLDNPVEYVRGVLGNMVDCRKEHGAAFVRIGTTGRGIAPHYRVEPEGPLLDRLFLERFFKAYHGRNHKLLEWGHSELRGEHWSDTKTSYDDVQSLLGELRGFKRRKA